MGKKPPDSKYIFNFVWLPASMRLWPRKLKNVTRFVLDGQDVTVTMGNCLISFSCFCLASLNTKSWFSLRIQPDTEPHVPASTTASEYSSQNTMGSKYKTTQLKNWCGALCGKWKPPEDCNFLQWFWCYYMLNSISARSLCSGKFLANSVRISFKDSFPELCITEELYDKLFCRAY